MPSIAERAKKVMAEHLEVTIEDLAPEKRFDTDLGADSLDTVEVVMGLEEEFHIDIQDEDAEKFKNVGDVIEYLEKNAPTTP